MNQLKNANNGRQKPTKICRRTIGENNCRRRCQQGGKIQKIEDRLVELLKHYSNNNIPFVLFGPLFQFWFSVSTLFIYFFIWSKLLPLLIVLATKRRVLRIFAFYKCYEWSLATICRLRRIVAMPGYTNFEGVARAR